MQPKRPPLWIYSLLMLCSLTRATMGEAPTVLLNLPTATVPAGEELAAELVVFNSSAQPLAYELPARLTGRLTKAGQSWPVTFPCDSGALTVPAAGFVRLSLRAPMPAGAFGRLVLELDSPVEVRGVIDVRAAAAIARPSERSAAPDETLPGDPAGRLAVSRLKRYYPDHFSAHEPIYFVYGSPRPAAKFQFSFKYRLLDDTGPLATRLPVLNGLHLAYTQRSLWDFGADSRPFYDTSYMPELMFESLAPDTGKHTGLTWLGYQVAVEHESNGRDGAASRSLNTFYFRPMFILGNPEGWRVILRPKFFVYLTPLNENPDLKKYRGYSELRAIFGLADRLSVSVTGRIGEDFDKGSAQIDATYPTQFITGNFDLYLLAQYWSGYGESLLDYAKRSSAVRFGVSLAR